MKTRRTALWILLGALSVALILVVVYFFAFPEITYFQASHEDPLQISQVLKAAFLGWRLETIVLNSDVLDDKQALKSCLESSASEGILLSSGVAFRVKKTDFRKDENGPVVMALSQDDPKGQFDIIFEYSPCSGWDNVASYLTQKGKKAVVLVTQETKEFENIFSDEESFFLVQADEDSLRAADKALGLYQSKNADFICCPYVSNIKDYFGKQIPASWITDSTMTYAFNKKFVYGTVQDDIFQTLSPVLKAGPRHSKLIKMPLARGFVRKKALW